MFVIFFLLIFLFSDEATILFATLLCGIAILGLSLLEVFSPFIISGLFG